MTRIAYFGGSFNPPHLGHVLAATTALWTGEVDAVWWAPSVNHPFARDLAPFEDRVRLCAAAIAQIGCDKMFVTHAENDYADPEIPNYTYVILSKLREAFGSYYTFRPLLGSDILATASKWKFWEELNREFPPLVLGREGYAGGMGAPIPNISSTEVRDRVRQGESLRGLIPPSMTAAVEALYK